MFKRLRWLLMFCIVFVVGIVDVAALEHADTSTYFDTGRRSGLPITKTDKVKIDTIIPNEYSFSLGEKYDSTIPNVVREISKDDIVRYHLNDSYLGYASKIDDIEKGKFSTTYVNVGTYGGKKVDVKLTVMDFEACSDDAIEGSELAFISFGNESIKSHPLGIFTDNVNWVEVKYDFYESGTTKEIKVKGYTSYWNLAGWQGIHFINNNVGFYGSNLSTLGYSSIDSKPFIFNNNRHLTFDFNGYVSNSSIVETFKGTSMTRVYSFTYPSETSEILSIGGAHGTVLHSTIVPYGLKSYAKDTPAGAGGSEVKIGDHIKYQIQVSSSDISVLTDNLPTSNYFDSYEAFVKMLSNDEVLDTDDIDERAYDLIVKITDSLSKGLNYVEGSSKLVIDSYSNTKDISIGDPQVSNTDSGKMLVWKDISFFGGASAILTYEVEVTSDDISEVSNSASAVITNICSENSLDPRLNANVIESFEDSDNGCTGEKKLTLNKLVNPLVKEKKVSVPEKKSNSDKIINVPDTGSVIALSSIIGGFALVVSGSYMIYRENKNKKK